MAQKIVGLDIGSYSIKGVVVESTYRGWELIGYHEMKIASEFVEAAAMLEPDVLSKGDTDPIKGKTEQEPGKEPGSDLAEKQPAEEIFEKLDPKREKIRAAIQEFIRRYGADWDTIITALDGDTISLKLINLPFTENKQVDAILNSSLEEIVPFSLEGKVVDYQILNKSQEESYLLAGLLDRERMADYLSDFTSAGKEPKGVTVDGLALANLFEQLAGGDLKTGHRALIDIGHRKSCICVFKDGRLNYFRSVPFGGQNLTRLLCHEFDLDMEMAERGKHMEGFVSSAEQKPQNPDQQAISAALEQSLIPFVHQVKLTFQAYIALSRGRIESVHLTGGGSKLTNLPAFLSEALECPVLPFHYLKEEFNRLPDSASVEPEMACGLGMAFSGLSGHQLKRLNFRKGDFAFKGDFEYWRGKFGQLALYLSLIFLFFIVNIWSQFHVLGSEDRKLSDAISKACNQILGQEVKDAKICVSQMLEVIGQQGGGGGKLKPEISTLTIYDELISRMTQGDISVDIEELDVSDKKIKLKGEVDAIATVGLIVDNLKQYNCFHNINQGPTRSSVKGDRIQFSLSINVDCATRKRKDKDKDEKEKEDKEPKDSKDSAKAHD